MKSGFVSLVGRPNVGKSSLLNSLIGVKIAITSNKPQTTRNIIQGIYNDNDSQIIFVDTPGIHKPNHKLGQFLNRQAYFSISDVDIILFVVDITEPLGGGDKFVIERLKQETKPVILVLNKIDKLPYEQILPKIDEYKDLYNFAEIVPLSAIKHDNLDRLIEVIKKYLKDPIKYFEDGMITSSNDNFIISELIREKILNLTEDEVPHSVTCVIDEMIPENAIINIKATIIVDRDAIKKIIVGKNGMMIKEIGTQARLDIEKFIGQKVYLELFVKTIRKWRDKDRYLNELGFRDLLDK